MKSRLAVIAAVSIAACAPAAAPEERNAGPAGESEEPLPAPPGEDGEETGWDGYSASGTEPFWNVQFSGGQMVFEHLDAPGARAPRPEPQATANGHRFVAQAGGQPFIVEIAGAYCTDAMSGRPYPDSVTVTANGSTFRGCGGDTASLITGRPWQVTRVGERSVAGSHGMTVRFAADGSISGYGGCNRYTGRYEIGGEGIETGPMASTRRACLDPAIGSLEHELLAALGALRQFRIAADGSLLLIAEDDTEIAARR